MALRGRGLSAVSSALGELLEAVARRGAFGVDAGGSGKMGSSFDFARGRRLDDGPRQRGRVNG